MAKLAPPLKNPLKTPTIPFHNIRYLPDVDEDPDRNASIKERCVASELLNLFNPWYIFGVPDHGIQNLTELERRYDLLRDHAKMRGAIIFSEPYREVIEKSYVELKNILSKAPDAKVSSETRSAPVNPSPTKTQTTPSNSKTTPSFDGNPYTFRIEKNNNPSLPIPASLTAANKAMNSYRKNDFLFRSVLAATISLSFIALIAYAPAVIPIAIMGLCGIGWLHKNKKDIQAQYREEVGLDKAVKPKAFTGCKSRFSGQPAVLSSAPDPLLYISARNYGTAL